MNRKIFTLLTILILSLSLLSGCVTQQQEPEKEKEKTASATVAQTRYGDIRGAIENRVLTFKGVPFAAPPVGALRFEPPQEPQPWEGTLNCTLFQPSALQKIRENSKIEHAEDCLYLNIWAPEDALTAEKKYPVYVYIHGGAYAVGSAADSKISGASFAQDGVIQVNIEYRLNALGFLNDPAMKEGGGNLGTLDQIAALKWVKSNIANFGGDPNNITIGGESAGAMSVSAMMLSPAAKGLFSRAIMESGNLLGQPIIAPKCSGSLAQTTALSRKFLHSMNADSFEDLRKMKAQKLVDSSLFSTNLTTPTDYYFFPTFDGTVLPKNPYKALIDGKLNKVDILTGYNTDEGSAFIPEGLSKKDYRRFVKQIFGKAAAKVLKRYPVDNKHNGTARARQIIKYGFSMGSSLFADELSRQGSKVYQYNFDYHVPIFDQTNMGVRHGLELYFVFNTILKDMQLNPDGNAFQTEMHNRWIGFIKTGDPNAQLTDKDAHWPAYTLTDKNNMLLNGSSSVITAPDQEDTAFFRDLLWEK